MPTYKNIRIPKRGGGTRIQRVQVLRSGKYKFVKNTTRKRTSKPKRATSKKRKSTSKGGKNMARRLMTIPIAPTVGFLAGLIPAIQNAMKGNIAGSGGALEQLAYNYTGIRHVTTNPTFDINGLKIGLLPLIIGMIIHKFVGGTLGLNRMLGRAKVPLLRL